MTLATAQGFGYRVAHGRMLRGWALAMQGDAATGVSTAGGRSDFKSIGPKL